jgi:hypothetical protein
MPLEQVLVYPAVLTEQPQRRFEPVVDVAPLRVVEALVVLGPARRYVNQEPDVFYLLVESAHVDWTQSVEEAVAGTVTGSAKYGNATARER